MDIELAYLKNYWMLQALSLRLYPPSLLALAHTLLPCTNSTSEMEYSTNSVLHIVCEHSVLLYWTICLQGPFLLLIHLLPIHEANPRPLSCLLCNVTSLVTLLISSSSQSRRTIFISSHGAGSQLCLWGGWTPHVTKDELLLVSSCGSRSCKRGVFAQRFIICRALSSTLSHLVFKTSLQAWYYYHYLIYRSLGPLPQLSDLLQRRALTMN